MQQFCGCGCGWAFSGHNKLLAFTYLPYIPTVRAALTYGDLRYLGRYVSCGGTTE